LQNYVGELAALATSFLFSISSTIFTLAGKRVGSVALNRTRLVMATLWLLLAHGILGIPLPWHTGAERWFWFSLSGVLGLAVGDAFLFEAFIRIGPRISMLVMALAPAIAALLAWIFLGESLNIYQVAGIGITMVGIALVVTDRNGQVNHSRMDQKNYLIGLLIGLGAATGQALGLVTARPGLGGGFPALSGTLIRMFAAMIALWGLAFFRRQVGDTLRTLMEGPRVLLWIAAAAFLGPTLGVTFSLVAIQNTEVGVASTLTALAPVFLLPIGYLFYKERFGWKAVLGTIVAILGVGFLFLV
jgi:drug/metabolite transporter (DMT)-like permease